MRTFIKCVVSFVILMTCLYPVGVSGQALVREGKKGAGDILSKTMVTDGFGVQLKGHSDSREDLDQVKNLGLKWVRHGFIWSSVEKQKGIYDFSSYDKLVEGCRERGLKMVGCIAFGNEAVYESHAKNEPARSAYARYAAELVKRYKDYDIVWEIWNEPNTMTFWGRHGGVGNSEQYAQEYFDLVQATVPAMKKANPDCIVMGGSVSNMWSQSYQWMKYAFKKGLLKTGIDILSVHPYGLKSPEDYVEAYDTTRTLMINAGGPVLPLFDTERGFPLGKLEGYAGGDEKMRYEYQAWHIVRQYLMDQYLDVIGTIWYEWIGKAEERSFSLYDKEKELPVYLATKVLIEQLRGYELKGRIDVGSPRDFVLSFTNQSGATKLVAWTSPPPMENPDKTIPHTVSLVVKQKGVIETTDIYGNHGALSAHQGSLKLQLSGAPIYVNIK